MPVAEQLILHIISHKIPHLRLQYPSPGLRCCWNSRHQSSGYPFVEERHHPSPPSPPTTVRLQEAQQFATKGFL